MMPNNNKTDRGERGQALILFSFMIVVLLIAVMCVVDVGFYLHAREKAQQTADAAALAGAQDLPDNPDQAEADALTYVALNGLDPAKTTITFSCTSDSDEICQDGDGRYDTIRVTPKVNSPTFFGSMLSVIGVNNCWVKGCNAQASAAGCRGACGPIGTGPADIMTILDHSGSMKNGALDNAENAINSMFGDFDNTHQQVGLVVTPAVKPSNMCNAVNHWTDALTWMPSGLTTGFQSSPHVLNTSNAAVHYNTCSTLSSTPPVSEDPWCGCGHTNLGDPMEVAANELAAHGRADVTWGIIMVTDGAANMAPSNLVPLNTVQQFCTAQAAVTSSAGDNNGYQTNASGVCADGGTAGQDPSSGNSTSTTCPDTTSTGGSGASGKDKHLMSNFGVSIPSSPTPTIDGIEIRLDAWATSGATTRRVCVQLSWDNGSHWTTAQYVSLSGTSQSTYILGDTSDDWGHTWTASQLADGQFKVRVTNVASNTSTTFNLDAVAAQVWYHTVDPSNLGPCHYAMQKSTAAKALGIEIYMIGFGLSATEKCQDFGELPSSPYYNYTAAQFLTAMATDSDHFFNAPKTEDLTDIFKAIGGALTGGSRLVE
jgi:hypothetical protein